MPAQELMKLKITFAIRALFGTRLARCQLRQQPRNTNICKLTKRRVLLTLQQNIIITVNQNIIIIIVIIIIIDIFTVIIRPRLHHTSPCPPPVEENQVVAVKRVKIQEGAGSNWMGWVGVGGCMGEEGDDGKGMVRGDGGKVRWWGESRRRRKRRRGRDKWSKGETIGQKSDDDEYIGKFFGPGKGVRLNGLCACAKVSKLTMLVRWR